MQSDLLEQVAGFKTLGEVTEWVFAQKPPASIANVVAQDEYTHDIVVKASDVYLVFDTT